MAAREIHTESTNAPSLEFAEECIAVRLRWNEAKFRTALVKFLRPQGMEVYGAAIKVRVPSPPRHCPRESQNSAANDAGASHLSNFK